MAISLPHLTTGLTGRRALHLYLGLESRYHPQVSIKLVQLVVVISGFPLILEYRGPNEAQGRLGVGGWCLYPQPANTKAQWFLAAISGPHPTTALTGPREPLEALGLGVQCRYHQQDKIKAQRHIVVAISGPPPTSESRGLHEPHPEV